MKTYTFKVLLFGLALLGLGTAYHRSARQLPNLTNKTNAVEIISLLPTKNGYKLTLRNVSTKNINGYSIGFGKGAIVTADLTSAYQLIAPGDQFTEDLPEATNIVIRHVIFEDDSIDGDAAAAAEQQDRRAGMREQLERIVPLVNAATESADVVQLKAQLQALPEESAAGRSVYVAAGMRNAKEDALLEVEKLDKSNIQAGLMRLSEQNSRHMMRLQTKRVNPSPHL